jgi:hypothetical protein
LRQQHNGGDQQQAGAENREKYFRLNAQGGIAVETWRLA